MFKIETERLWVRKWEEKYLEPFAAMNADARVMEYFPSIQTFEESRASMEWAIAATESHGYHFLPLIEKNSGAFAGLAGLSQVNFDAHFTPAVEVSWRLPFEFWGKGYASESARAFLDYGFNSLGLAEIVSFTAKGNHRSRAVMDRIGMTHDRCGDFIHPSLESNNPLAHHVLYRIQQNEFSGSTTRPD